MNITLFVERDSIVFRRKAAPHTYVGRKAANIAALKTLHFEFDIQPEFRVGVRFDSMYRIVDMQSVPKAPS